MIVCYSVRWEKYIYSINDSQNNNNEKSSKFIPKENLKQMNEKERRKDTDIRRCKKEDIL